MATPILATKLYMPPPRPNAVERPRLLDRLDEGLHRKMTLVAAPAGFGKTTLVSEWIAGGARPAAWYSLDEGDSNGARFLAYLIAALQTIAPGFGSEVLNALQSHAPPGDEILTVLVNETAALPKDVVLVLDDYHAVESADVDRILVFLLEHLPPQMHLVVTTREDPQLPLARMRARGLLTELRAADLRFTPAEAGLFFGQAMEMNLSPAEVAALERRTEGWIAGLQLAALSMQGREDVHEFIRAFSGDNRYIVDYLVEEVLAHQPQELSDFLQQTSILEQMSGPLCDAVRFGPEERSAAQDSNSQAILEALERNNLFVVPLDDVRRWFRYHHLFADVLRAHLQHDDPELERALHRRASDWYERNGMRANAIRHALAGEDYFRAAELVELVWPEMDGTFQPSTWLAWKMALPDEIVSNRPVLAASHAWALLDAGEMEAGDIYLQTTEEMLEAPDHEQRYVDEDQYRKLPASLATARAYRAQALGDVAGTVQYGSRALALLPADDHIRRGPAAALISLAYWANGLLEEAAQALADAMAQFELAGQLNFAVSGTFGLADIRLAQGRLREAERVYRRSLRIAAPYGTPVVRGASYVYLGLSEMHREQGDLEAAAQLLAKANETRDQPPLTNFQYRYHLDQAMMAETLGNLDDAIAQLDEAASHYVRTPIPDVRPIPALKARLWTMQGKIDAARAWARTAGVTTGDELTYLREFEHMTLARVLMGEYEQTGSEPSLREATALLARLLEAAENGNRMGSVLNILILRSLAQQAGGAAKDALESLGRALALAEPEGYVRVFVDEGPSMEGLLVRAQEMGSPTGTYVEALLAAFRPQYHVTSEPHHLVEDGAQPLVEPLTERELEVLELVAKGLTNREIGEQLYLALDTVKGHNRRIFGKLQVKTRTEAVSRAREARLL